MSSVVPFEIVVIVVIVALGFDFMNGFHDAANSVATVVSTRVLTPRVAVLWAAFFNFAAAFAFGVNVASTIGKGTIDPKIVTAWLLLAVLTGAIDCRRQQDSILHSIVSRHWLLRRNWLSPAHGENCHAVFPFHVRSRVPTTTTCLRGPLQSRARDERRAEDNGDHSGTAFRSGTVRFDVLRSVLRHTVGGNCYGSWNLFRGMEDSSDYGYEDNEAAPFWRIQRRDRGCLNTFRHRFPRNPRKHNSHDSRGDHGRRLYPKALRGKMGSGP